MNTISTSPPTRLPRHDEPVVDIEVRRLRCPACGSLRVWSRHSDTLKDKNMIIRHSQCQDCGQRVRVTVK